MKRENFIKIIKLRSFWKIDRRKGNYKLPNGNTLRNYVAELVESQLALDGLGIIENGNLTFCTGGKWNDESKDFDDYTLMPPFGKTEYCTYDEMQKRISRLVAEITG